MNMIDKVTWVSHSLSCKIVMAKIVVIYVVLELFIIKCWIFYWKRRDKVDFICNISIV